MELASLKLKGNIANLTYEEINDIMDRLNEEGLEQMKNIVKRKDWNDLLVHRMYISDSDNPIAFNRDHNLVTHSS
jgi:hypothetical protein